MQELSARCLGWEDPLEKGMAPHSSILAWEIPHTEGPGGLQSMELQYLLLIITLAGNYYYFHIFK